MSLDRCNVCGEPFAKYGCSPTVALGYKDLCRNPATVEKQKAARFAEGLADLIKLSEEPNEH